VKCLLNVSDISHIWKLSTNSGDSARWVLVLHADSTGRTGAFCNCVAKGASKNEPLSSRNRVPVDKLTKQSNYCWWKAFSCHNRNVNTYIYKYQTPINRTKQYVNNSLGHAMTYNRKQYQSSMRYNLPSEYTNITTKLNYRSGTPGEGPVLEGWTNMK